MTYNSISGSIFLHVFLHWNLLLGPGLFVVCFKGHGFVEFLDDDGSGQRLISLLNGFRGWHTYLSWIVHVFEVPSEKSCMK